MAKRVGNITKWTSEEMELLEMMIDVPTIKELAESLGRGLRSVVGKLYNMKQEAMYGKRVKLDTGEESAHNNKIKELAIEETQKRIIMFQNLCKGQRILTKHIIRKDIKKYNLPVMMEIISNNGSFLICKLKNGSLINITKAEIVSKEVLVAVMKDYEEVI